MKYKISTSSRQSLIAKHSRHQDYWRNSQSVVAFIVEVCETTVTTVQQSVYASMLIDGKLGNTEKVPPDTMLIFK